MKITPSGFVALGAAGICCLFIYKDYDLGGAFLFFVGYLIICSMAFGGKD